MNATAADIDPGAEGRCPWCLGDPDYIAYHDHEWGMPVADDDRLFQALSLEGFQAGLSWLTILRKREHFSAAFAGFRIARVARFDETDIERLLADPGIVRHRGKIQAVIGNAGRALAAIREHGSLAAWLWRFAPSDTAKAAEAAAAVIPDEDGPAAARRLATELRRHGWRFVGPTTAHAFMQAVGMINDHDRLCPARERCQRAKARFRRPH